MSKRPLKKIAYKNLAREHPLSMPGRFCIFLVLNLSLFAYSARAEEVIDWESCVKEALRNNPSLLQYEQTKTQTEDLQRAAYKDYFPQPSATLSGTKTLYTYTKPIIASSANGTTTTSSTGALRRPFASVLAAPRVFGEDWGQSQFYNLELDITQNIFNGFLDQETLTQLQWNTEKANADILSARVQLGSDLKNAFYSQLYAQQLIDLNQEILKRREESVRLVELRYQNGSENKGSYLRSLASFHQAKFSVDQAKRALKVAQLQMSVVLGRKYQTALLVKGDFQEDGTVEEPVLEMVVRQHPSHLSGHAQIAAADAGIGIAKASLMPTVNFIASYLRDGNWPPASNDVILGLTVTIPIDAGGFVVASVRAAAAAKASLEAQFQYTDAQLAHTIEQAYVALQDAVETLKVQAELVEASKVQVTIAQEQYKLGLISFEDWDILETDLIGDQQTLLQNRRDLALARATYESALGKALGD